MTKVISQKLQHLIQNFIPKKIDSRDETKLNPNNGLIEYYLWGTKILSYGYINGSLSLIINCRGFYTRLTINRLNELIELLANGLLKIKSIKGTYYYVFNDGYKEPIYLNQDKQINLP